MAHRFEILFSAPCVNRFIVLLSVVFYGDIERRDKEVKAFASKILEGVFASVFD